jgi:hypothetical protein
MDSKTAKIGIGAGFGCVVGLSALFVMLASYPTWAWIAFFIGFGVGWIAYDFRAVLTAIQSAAITFPGTLHALREKRRQFHAENPLRRKLYLWRCITSAVCFSTMLPILYVSSTDPSRSFFDKQNELLAILTTIVSAFVCVILLIRIIGPDSPYPASTDEERIERHKDFVLRFNPVAVAIVWPMYLFFRYIIGNFSKWVPPVVLAVWKTIVAIFRALHSAERLISGSYATVGMGIFYLLCDNSNLPLVVDIIIGGLLSAALGMADYRLIKKYRSGWLPANDTA